MTTELYKTGELVTVDGAAQTQLAPTAPGGPQEIKTRVRRLYDVYDQVMEEGRDYGRVPGVAKPFLYRPGAELLRLGWNLTVEFEEGTVVRDMERDPAFLCFEYRCNIYGPDGRVIIRGAIGSANSYEDRYRWRWVPEQDVPSHYDKADLRSRGGRVTEFTFAVEAAETTGKYGKPDVYWQAFRDAIETGSARKVQRQARSGRSYPAWEIDMLSYRIPNEDIFTQLNTIQSMASKRAFVNGIRMATGASRIFTQDEDIVGGMYDEDNGSSTERQAAAEGDIQGDRAEAEPETAAEVPLEWSEFLGRASAFANRHPFYRSRQHVIDTVEQLKIDWHDVEKVKAALELYANAQANAAAAQEA